MICLFRHKGICSLKYRVIEQNMKEDRNQLTSRGKSHLVYNLAVKIEQFFFSLPSFLLSTSFRCLPFLLLRQGETQKKKNQLITRNDSFNSI